MTVERGYKTELDPSSGQGTFFERSANAARFVWNWGLAWKKQVMALNGLPIEHIRIPTAMDLHKELVRLKAEGPLSWLGSVSKCVAQESLRDLDRAFRNLHALGFGFPKFKSRKWAKRSFRITGDKVKVADNAIFLPKVGWVKLKERGYLPREGPVRILSATVTEAAGRWFVSLTVSERHETTRHRDGPVVGVDLGISRLATVSDGTTYENPRAYMTMERKLKRLQRYVSRKKDASGNRREAVRRLQRHHLRIANVRKDAINKATTELAKTKSVVVVESLRPRSMIKNRSLSKSLSDASFGEFVRQLQYKTQWYGSSLVKADPFFPSTKRCSSCGLVKDEMPLGERTYQCACGLVIDRDLNASRNLQQWPLVRRTLETPDGAERLQAARPVLGLEAGINQYTIGRVGSSCPPQTEEQVLQ